MIEAIDLTKRYEDGVVALDHLRLTVDPGEIYCLLGANGAGKTTAIYLFLHLIEPTFGEARIAGIDVPRDPLAAKEHLAYVSENVRLYDSFTARQNLDFFARLGRDEPLPAEEHERVLRQVGLPETAFDRKVRSFSKGMRQKLGIAIAILRDAPALLLDEPLSGLDPKAAAELVRILRGLRDRGKAILMSTHDIFRARDLADRIGIMKAGKKVFERTREELRHEDLETIYLEYMREPGESRELEVPSTVVS